MLQPSLPYKPSYSGRESWLLMLEALRAAVAYLGPKEVQDACDVNKTTMSEALNEQRDRRWAGEWTHVVIAMLDRQHTAASDELVKRILAAEAALSTRFVIADASDEPTAEEIAAAERVMAKVRARKRAA